MKPKKQGRAGLRRPEDVNKMLLAKLGWRVLTCIEETRCKLLQNKYCFDEIEPMIFKDKYWALNIWLGIRWSSDPLFSGLR